MPWRCPVCDFQIRHPEEEARPRPGIVYRCHVCRLELVFDPTIGRLTFATPENGESTKNPSVPG